MSSFMMQLSGGREMVNEDKAEVILVYFVYFGCQINGYTVYYYSNELYFVFCVCVGIACRNYCLQSFSHMFK
jgi:hypothetical protein